MARQLGLFDATMLVMGGIVGARIFMNPYVVAQQVHTPALILGAWIFGGIIAVGDAFIWAELAATMPEVGGQYAYCATPIIRWSRFCMDGVAAGQRMSPTAALKMPRVNPLMRGSGCFSIV
jgi:hypothetical protein